MSQNILIKFYKDRENIDLNYAFQIDSGVKGPHLIFVAATHGNEPAGAFATQKIVTELESGTLKLSKGKITFILANPLAFEKNIRFVNYNMNRVYSKDLPDNYEGNRASEIRKFLQNNPADLLIDIHSVSHGEIQMVAYLDINPKTKELALAISNLEMHFIPDTKIIPRSLMQEAEKWGTNAFAVESGNHTSSQSQIVAYDQFINGLEYFGMLEAQEKSQTTSKSITIYKTLDLVKPLAGFEYLDKKTHTGTFIQKSQKYASHSNGFYIAQQDSFIVMPCHNPSLNDTDAGWICSREIV